MDHRLGFPSNTSSYDGPSEWKGSNIEQTVSNGEPRPHWTIYLPSRGVINVNCYSKLADSVIEDSICIFPPPSVSRVDTDNSLVLQTLNTTPVRFNIKPQTTTWWTTDKRTPLVLWTFPSPWSLTISSYLLWRSPCSTKDEQHEDHDEEQHLCSTSILQLTLQRRLFLTYFLVMELSLWRWTPTVTSQWFGVCRVRIEPDLDTDWIIYFNFSLILHHWEMGSKWYMARYPKNLWTDYDQWRHDKCWDTGSCKMSAVDFFSPWHQILTWHLPFEFQNEW